MIAPVLDELANEYAGKLKICKVDVDANPDIPPKFGIRGIPTLIVFKDGNAEATKVGALSKTQLPRLFRKSSETPGPTAVGPDFHRPADGEKALDDTRGPCYIPACCTPVQP
jgi:thioredoxin-like negative regulator of GroEL